MPREIPSPVAGAATLEETVDAIAAGFDPRVEESVEAAAVHLARLANNRTFLGDLSETDGDLSAIVRGTDDFRERFAGF